MFRVFYLSKKSWALPKFERVRKFIGFTDSRARADHSLEELFPSVRSEMTSRRVPVPNPKFARSSSDDDEKDESRVPRFRIRIIVSGRILAALGVRALGRGARRRRRPHVGRHRRVPARPLDRLAQVGLLPRHGVAERPRVGGTAAEHVASQAGVLRIGRANGRVGRSARQGVLGRGQRHGARRLRGRVHHL